MFVATAGWSLPRTSAMHFPDEGTQLQRYARVMRGVEINTSAYRDHSAATYGKWARQTPRQFRFAVKLPQAITHDTRLRAARKPLAEFLEAVSALGQRLGPLVVQLPPSLVFEARVARTFFELLRNQHKGFVVCEPRHPSWFDPKANDLLTRLRVARVAADPAISPAAAIPGGWPGILYFRLHGSPRKYWSVYEKQQVAEWTALLKSGPTRTPRWCVFDNTASGGAAGNALQMRGLLRERV
jgi:uncharacterized protein YecE (DUF72 family)